MQTLFQKLQQAGSISISAISIQIGYFRRKTRHQTMCAATAAKTAMLLSHSRRCPQQNWSYTQGANQRLTRRKDAYYHYNTQKSYLKFIEMYVGLRRLHEMLFACSVA